MTGTVLTVTASQQCSQRQNLKAARERLAALLQTARRPDGQPARIARMDADTTRLKGALAQQLAHVHDGSVDMLVGTQMIAKGHDFRRVTLVAALNPDTALFSSDFGLLPSSFPILFYPIRPLPGHKNARSFFRRAFRRSVGR